jgi:BAH domain
VKGDVFGPEEEDGGFPSLKINYTIQPGKAWAELKTFRNFSSKLRISPHPSFSQAHHAKWLILVQNQKFSTGSVVYINKHTPPPEPPDSDASEAEILAFDRKNLWVGQVLEVKAANPSEVWLRVFWLYWPDELPKGRREYHGNQELIMSNHMEIVDAKAVTSMADISQWDEKDEDQNVGHRFWRQFYDVQLQGAKTGGLSEIRRHCVCNEYYNPDKTMLKCANPKCGIWNHQECLEEAILEKTYGRLIDDNSSTNAKTKPFPASKLAQLKSLVKTGSKEQNGQTSKSMSIKFWSSKKSTNQPSPWKGLLKADISVGERGGERALVTITDERAQDPKVWTEGIQCLMCGTSIDWTEPMNLPLS